MRPPRTVEELLKPYPPNVQALALAARTAIRKWLPGVEETPDPTGPVIGYGYGPGYKGIVCTLLVSKVGVKIGLVRGSELPDPHGLLEGSGKVHRFVALREVADLRRTGVSGLVKAAHAAWKKSGARATAVLALAVLCALTAGGPRVGSAAAVVPAAAPPQQFRLVGAIQGDDVVTEWVELSPRSLALEVDAVDNRKLWDVTIDLAGPTEARRIDAHMFNLALRAAPATLHVVAERTGNEIHIVTTDLEKKTAPESRTEPWPADGVFLPRGLVGCEQLVQETRALGIKSRQFTWVDPTFRTETGAVTLSDSTHAHVSIKNAMAGQPDEEDDFTLDRDGRIVGGSAMMGLTVRRGSWVAPASRAGGSPPMRAAHTRR